MYIIEWRFHGDKEYYRKTTKHGDTLITSNRKTAQRFETEALAQLQLEAIRMILTDPSTLKLTKV